jgi:hypothetical protein
MFKHNEYHTNGKVKFTENPNVTQVNDWIWIYKNFLDKPVIDKYTSLLDNLLDEQWNRSDTFGTGWQNKVSPDMIGEDVHQPIMEFLYPNFWIYRKPSFFRLRSGEFLPYENHERYFAQNGERLIGHYRVALYLGNFEGGSVNFFDQEFKFKPEPGDLMLVKIHPNYNYLVEEVTSGSRYVYSDTAIYNPSNFVI